ncbi:MAG: type II secretion system protein [Parcubacteria group bacterium]
MNSKGFTLVELIVSIAIVGILVVMINIRLDTVRANDRNAKRLSDLLYISTALEMYYDDNDEYPQGCLGTSPSGHGSDFGDCDTNYITNLINYIDPLPIDPSGDDQYGYTYQVSEDGQNYKLRNWRTVERITVDRDHAFAKCAPHCTDAHCDNSRAQKSFAIYTSGYACVQ